MEDRRPATRRGNRFRFRLGTTSYIIPAGLVKNTEYLAPRVDDIELVLFDTEGMSNYPDAGTVERLRQLATAFQLTYTVHLPVDARLGHADEATRARSVEKCLRVIELTAPLRPFAYVIHFDGDRRGGDPSPDIPSWLKRLSWSTEELLEAGLAPEMLCVESLDYSFEIIETIILEHGLSICLDLGHLEFYGFPLFAHLDRYLHLCRVVHLHGVENGQDHRGVQFFPPDKLPLVIERLNAETERERVVTLEVFDAADFARSLDILENLPSVAGPRSRGGSGGGGKDG